MPPSDSLETLLTFSEARHTVEEHAARIQPPAALTLPLLDAIGCVLAEPLIADRDFPPFPRAARDGYALRAEDLSALPARLQVVGEIRAGDSLASLPNIQSGQAAVIMTGAAAPVGADAVVMVEYTQRDGAWVVIESSVTTGENIVAPGSECRSGTMLLPVKARVDEVAVAVAASIGKGTLLTFRRPRVAILSTGDEIVALEARPAPHQIRNSNSYSLAAQVIAAGGHPVILPHAPDDPVLLRDRMAEGLQMDLLLVSGGVSMGQYDLVEPVLAEMGAEFFFTGARIQPGKPVVFGRAPKSPASSAAASTYFFGLPGNPVSTMVTFALFVEPLLDALRGASPRPLLFLKAQLKAEIRTKPGLTRFLPALLSGSPDQPEVELVRWQGSGDIASTARSNCFAVIPPERERIAPGEWVGVLPRLKG